MCQLFCTCMLLHNVLHFICLNGSCFIREKFEKFVRFTRVCSHVLSQIQANAFDSFLSFWLNSGSVISVCMLMFSTKTFVSGSFKLQYWYFTCKRERFQTSASTLLKIQSARFLKLNQMSLEERVCYAHEILSAKIVRTRSAVLQHREGRCMTVVFSSWVIFRALKLKPWVKNSNRFGARDILITSQEGHLIVQLIPQSVLVWGHGLQHIHWNPADSNKRALRSLTGWKQVRSISRLPHMSNGQLRHVTFILACLRF